MPTTHTLTLNGRTFNPECKPALSCQFFFMKDDSSEEIRKFLGFEAMGMGIEHNTSVTEEISPNVYRTTTPVQFHEMVCVNRETNHWSAVGTRTITGTWVTVNDYSALLGNR